MRKFRSDKLGIEIEITGETLFKSLEVKETRNCARISCEGKKVATILPDSKIEFENLNHVICYKGRVVVFGDAYIEAGGMSKIFAKDKAQVVAFQGAEVRAGGRTKVRALDNSRVIAGGRAEVFLEGESIGYKWQRSRAKMNKLDNRVTVFNLN